MCPPEARSGLHTLGAARPSAAAEEALIEAITGDETDLESRPCIQAAQ